MDIVAFKQKFDPILEKYLNNKIQASAEIVKNKRIQSILEHIQTITFAGGKRIRPYCLYMWYHIYQTTESDDIRKFAMLFELLHTMALIHDDIIDEANKRHNVATIPQYIQDTNHDTISKRIAEWQAILAGDLVLSRVYEVLNTTYNIDPEQLSWAQKTVHEMIQEVVLWQMIDVELSIWDEVQTEMLERKNLYKTARYTFARPLVAGAQLAWANIDQIQLLNKIGESLWLAYQLRDDLLDILEVHKDKDTFSDVQEWQQTLITDYINKHTNKTYKSFLDSCMGKSLNQEQITELKSIFEESWAISFAKEKIATYVQDAAAMLENIDFKNESARNYIHQLMHKLTTI